MTDRDRMAQVTKLTREGRLTEAMAMLRGAQAGPKPSGNRRREGLRETLRDLAEKASAYAPTASPGTPPPVPEGVRWERRTYTGPAGSRPYALYVPARLAPDPALVLMLHGCTQGPEDFARGTRMNEHAERHGFVVAYPEQPRSENQNGCWNWFEPRHQGRGAGEPAILAGIAAEMGTEFSVGRTFAAGLSAGGAAAAILAGSYPDAFAAVCVHSGLPAGAASGLPGALQAMQGGARTTVLNDAPVPMLIIHGDADRTVNAANADGLVRQALGAAAATIQSREAGEANGRRFVRETEASPDGTVLSERITVQGGGHAWFGGDPSGSHTDAGGPDASDEVVRFFGLKR